MNQATDLSFAARMRVEVSYGDVTHCTNTSFRTTSPVWQTDLEFPSCDDKSIMLVLWRSTWLGMRRKATAVLPATALKLERQVCLFGMSLLPSAKP